MLLSILGSTMGDASEFKAMLEFVSDGKVEPVIDRVFALDDGRAALLPQQAAAANGGVVRSTQDAAGYTYIELTTDAGDVVWLATPETELADGSRVTWQGGSTMTNFTSSSLDKTFPEILFVQSIHVVQ